MSEEERDIGPEKEPLPTEFNVKAAVRERDGWRCVDCGVDSQTYHAATGKKLDVHRTVPGVPYAVEACVTLCRKCHAKRHRVLNREKRKRLAESTVRPWEDLDWSDMLRQSIRTSGRSLNEIEAATGIDHSALSRFMRGTRTITLPSASRIGNLLGVELLTAAEAEEREKALANEF